MQSLSFPNGSIKISILLFSMFLLSRNFFPFLILQQFLTYQYALESGTPDAPLQIIIIIIIIIIMELLCLESGFLSMTYRTVANLARLGVSIHCKVSVRLQYLVRLPSLYWMTGGQTIHPSIEGINVLVCFTYLTLKDGFLYFPNPDSDPDKTGPR